MWCPQVTGCATCRCVNPGITISAPRSACATSARISAVSPSTAASHCPRTQSRKSVATWSFRDRAVCSRPAGSPISAFSRLSTFMWMSSSAFEKAKPAGLDLRQYREQPFPDRLRVAITDDARGAEHGGMGAARLDVLRRPGACRSRSMR